MCCSTVAVFHLAYNATHLAEIEFAEQQEYRRAYDYDVCKCGIHEEEIDKRGDKLHGDDDDEWQDLGHEVHDVVHITKEAVHYITAVIAFDATPPAFEQPFEELLLHQVLATHSEHSRNPGMTHVAQEITGHDQNICCSHDEQMTLLLAGSDVGELTQELDTQQAQSHLHESDHNIGHCLQPTSFVVAPQPCHYGACSMFRLV